VSAESEDCTRWVGSSMKCFDDILSVLLSRDTVEDLGAQYNGI
jgi:hypothetical protein